MSTSVATTLPPETQPADLTVDTVFSTLSNARRRDVLALLSTDEMTETPVGIRDLAERVAAWENDVAPEAVTYKQRKRVYTSLHQTHLPMLRDAGLIEAERAWEDLTLTPRAEALTVYLDEPTPPTPWSNYYFGFAVVGLLLAGVAWVGLYPFALLPGLVYATALALALFATAVVHAVAVRR